MTYSRIYYCPQKWKEKSSISVIIKRISEANQKNCQVFTLGKWCNKYPESTAYFASIGCFSNDPNVH